MEPPSLLLKNDIKEKFYQGSYFWLFSHVSENKIITFEAYIPGNLH